MTPSASASIRSLAGGEAAACERIMRSLPAWFGIETSIVEYRRALDVLDTFVAELDGELVGFLALDRRAVGAAEIRVMAVREQFHRMGVGSALLEHVERALRSASIEYLEVKTLGPSRPDPHYERTRRFYLSQGFQPIEETHLWGPANPCLIMVKHLRCAPPVTQSPPRPSAAAAP